MTKARDLAGFASSSVTTTASDGLVLKGDGSSTDVVIKNGANATVASVADGTVNIAAAGSITATGASVGALARGSIQVGNSSGVAAPLVAGGADTVLTSDGTDLSFAAVGSSDVVWPSNIASPNNTYTSSGTWSKGSLDDDDYVWIYLVGGGQGGRSSSSYSDGTVGGAALLIYGKAKFFDGGAYVVGAGTAGSSTTSAPALGAASTFTTTSTHGSTTFTTADAVTSNGGNQPSPSATLFNTFTGAGTKQTTTNIIATAPRTHDFLLGTPITGWVGITSATTHWNFGQATNSVGQNGIFGGGAGGAVFAGGVRAGGGSLYAGAGGASSGDGVNLNGTAGTVPGGAGGAGGTGTSVGGAGADGNVRVYHV